MAWRIDLECEQAELQRHLGKSVLEFIHHRERLYLNCRFLRHGFNVHTQDSSFDHAPPPFCRLFVFFQRGARITVAGNEIELKPGGIYLLPDSMGFEICYKKSSQLLYFHVNVTDGCRIPIFGSLRAPLSLHDSALSALFYEQRTLNWGVRLQAAASGAIAQLSEPHHEEMHARACGGNEFSPIFALMARHPIADIRLTQLARECGLSAAALAKRFKRKMGVSLKTYLTQEAVNQSRHALLYTAMTVTMVSDHLGFSDPHYFHRFFRKHAGMSPAQYRAEHTQQSP